MFGYRPRTIRNGARLMYTVQNINSQVILNRSNMTSKMFDSTTTTIHFRITGAEDV